MTSVQEPLFGAASERDDRADERLTLRQARVLEVLASAGAPVSGEAVAARLGLRAGSLSVTLRSLQRRGLIAAASRERARPPGWCCANAHATIPAAYASRVRATSGCDRVV